MTVAELIAKLGIDIDRKSWDKAEKGFDKLKHAAEGVVEALAIHKIKEGLEHMIEGTVESAHSVELLSQQLGLSTDKVQELGFATKSMGEGGMAMSLRQLAMHANAAATKGGEAGAVFSRLGVSLRGANGKLLPVDQLLERVADGMQRTRDPTERMAYATQLFGRNGVRMISVLKDGSEGLRKKYEMARKYGIMSKEMIELAHEEHEAQVGVNYMMKALQGSIVEKLLPAKIKLLQITQDVILFFGDLVHNTQIVKEAMVLLGVVVGVLAVRSMVAFFATLGLVTSVLLIFAAVMFFVIDDILATLRGADSLGKRLNAWVDGVFEGFMKWTAISPVINALLLPIKELAFNLKIALDSFNALIMAASGDFSGFKVVDEEIAEHYKQIKDQAAQGAFGKTVGGFLGYTGATEGEGFGFDDHMQLVPLGGGRSTVAPSAMASAASSRNVSLSQGPMTVHQTINAAPGQDASEIGDASVESLSDWHSAQNEMALNQLVPLSGGASGGE
jgi:hypothetical protein